jgi:hypothetical protein
MIKNMNIIMLSLIILNFFAGIALAATNETQLIEPGSGCRFMANLPPSLLNVVNDLKGMAGAVILLIYAGIMFSEFGKYAKEKGEDGDAIKKKNHLTNMFMLTIVLILIYPLIQFGASYFTPYGSC